MAAIDDGLKKLEYLSLVSKVCSELETHLGFGDKVLAEFITEMGRNCESVDEFDAKLKEHGAEMPDYFVRTLLTIIHAILPPKPKSEDDSKKESTSEGKTSKFKALSIADNRDRVRDIQREIEMEAKEKRNDQEELGDELEEDRRRHRGRDRDRERDTDRDRDRDRDSDRRGRGRDRYDRDERRRDTRHHDYGRGRHRRDEYEEDGDRSR